MFKTLTNANNLRLPVIPWRNVLTLKDHFFVNAIADSLEMVLSIVQVYMKTYLFIFERKAMNIFNRNCKI
jgi:hypothetical protein